VRSVGFPFSVPWIVNLKTYVPFGSASPWPQAVQKTDASSPGRTAGLLLTSVQGEPSGGQVTLTNQWPEYDRRLLTASVSKGACY